MYGLNWTGDCLRKASQVPLVGGTFVKEYFENKSADLNDDSDNVVRGSLNDKIRQLEIEKTKYRDQRSEWAKQNRAQARIEDTLEILEQSLNSIGCSRYQPISECLTYSYSDKEMIVCLSDLHAGMSFSNAFGSYDTDILSKRMSDYLSEIRKIARIHQVEKIYVVCMGDLISGNIHKTIAVSNKENVIEQIKIAAVEIADFCAALCEAGYLVQFHNVSGNHSRIAKKEEAVHDERLDDLIGWIVSCLLKNQDNFTTCTNVDTGISVLDTLAGKFVAVHGDFDYATEASMYKLTTMLGFIPFGLFCGHRHTPAYKDLNGIKMIQSGSMCGSGDSYTLEKRLSGHANQTVAILTQKGIHCIYNIDLED